MRVVDTLSDDMPLTNAANVLSSMLCERLHRRRQGLLLRNLRRAVHFSAAADRVLVGLCPSPPPSPPPPPRHHPSRPLLEDSPDILRHKSTGRDADVHHSWVVDEVGLTDRTDLLAGALTMGLNPG